jgi:hypothetical protein
MFCIERSPAPEPHDFNTACRPCDTEDLHCKEGIGSIHNYRVEVNASASARICSRDSSTAPANSSSQKKRHCSKSKKASCCLSGRRSPTVRYLPARSVFTNKRLMTWNLERAVARRTGKKNVRCCFLPWREERNPMCLPSWSTPTVRNDSVHHPLQRGEVCDKGYVTYWDIVCDENAHNISLDCS